MATPKNETAARAAEDLRETAASARASAKDEVETRGEGAKHSLADEISRVASALKTASREFRRGSTEANTFDQIAQGLEGASNSVRQRSLGEMFSDLNTFARRHPATFLGGAALFGFAVSRFARASSEDTSQKDDSHSRRSTSAELKGEAKQ